MEIFEFGKKGKRKLILIHGFLMPYKIWDKYIEHYKNDFHIIVLILPGHNPNKKDDFISFYKVAKEFEYYYFSLYGENVYAIYAMSMGGVLASILWQNNRLKIEKLIIDGSPLVSINPFIKKIILNFYLDITSKVKLNDKDTLENAKKVFPKEYLKDFLLVINNMSDKTIINCVNEVSKFKLSDDLDNKYTKIYYFYGTKLNEFYAQKTAQFIVKNYRNSYLKCFHGKGHCEVMLFNVETMINELDNIL